MCLISIRKKSFTIKTPILLNLQKKYDAPNFKIPKWILSETQYVEVRLTH